MYRQQFSHAVPVDNDSRTDATPRRSTHQGAAPERRRSLIAGIAAHEATTVGAAATPPPASNASAVSVTPSRAAFDGLWLGASPSPSRPGGHFPAAASNGTDSAAAAFAAFWNASRSSSVNRTGADEGWNATVSTTSDVNGSSTAQLAYCPAIPPGLRELALCLSFRRTIRYDLKGSPYSITERRVPELIPVLGSQPAVT